MEPSEPPLDVVRNKPPWSSIPQTEPACVEVGGWLVSHGNPVVTDRRGGTTIRDRLG
jgi:hypothetical protein